MWDTEAYSRSLWGLFLVFLQPLVTNTSSDTELLNICQFQSFNATCKSHEIIMITSARYGRMAIGRCVKLDYGYVGCSVDVLKQLDRRCSGRRSCSVAIPDPTLHAMQPCPGELSAYLEASYTCLPVETTPMTSCINRRAILTEPVGYLASITAMETGYGTDACPWVISAKPGQQINLTLYDFTPISREGEYCRAYAIVREPDGQQSHTVCSKQSRIQQAFISKGNKLEVRMLNTRKADADYFLFKYTVVGCPKYQAPPNSRVRLEGSHILVTCNSTDQSWKLTCNENKWIGPAPNCSAETWNIQGVLKKVVSLPFEVTLVLISSIAFVVVTVILVIGLLCLRRRRLRNEVPRVNPLLGDHPDKDAYSSGTIHGSHLKSYITMEQRNNKHRSFGEYASIWNSHGPGEPQIFPPRRSREEYPLPELPPAMGIVDDPVPVGYAGTPGVHLVDTGYNDQEIEHIYESPKFVRRERVDVNGLELPMYFELDPDGHPINTDRSSSNNNNRDKRRTSDPGYHQQLT